MLIRFNEAAGIHRRKGGDQAPHLTLRDAASMRPPEFTGGKWSQWLEDWMLRRTLQ